MPYRGRHSIRLQGRSYRQPGAYMLTICTHQRRHILARVANGRMHPSATGLCAMRCWEELPLHFANIQIDAFVVMTHHVHGIVIIRNWCGVRPREELKRRQVSPGSLGAIVRSYKAAVTREVHRLNSVRGPVWQRNYWERVLRDQSALEIARRYVHNNPANWIRRHGNHPTTERWW
jgi:REP element-mobilizing transposase RayT